MGGSAGNATGTPLAPLRGEEAKNQEEDEADRDVTASLLDRDLPLPAGAEEADFAGAAKAVVAGGSHVMVLTNMGGVWSWGSNAFGQLGLGHFEDQHRPRLVRALAGVGVDSIAAGWRHSIAVVDGGIVAWGHTSAVPTVTPIPMPPPPPGVREDGASAEGEGEEWAGAQPAHGRLDLTHAVSPLPLESPFRTTHRTALAALCAFSHTLSISVVAYTELLLGHDPRRPPVTAVERAQGRLQLWKRHEREVLGSGAGHSRGLAALAAIAATVEEQLDANGGLDADGEDSDEAASVPDELRDDAYVTGARRLPVAGYVDSYVTRVRASLPVTAAQAAAAAEAGTDVHSVARRKSKTGASMARIAANTGPASMDVSGRAAAGAGAGAGASTAASKRSDMARRTMGQRRPTLSFLSPAAATPLGLSASGPARPKARPATAGTAGAGPLGAAPPPPPPRRREAGAGGMFAHRPTEAVRTGLEASLGGAAGAQRSEAEAERARQAHRESAMAAINAAAVSADAEREVIDAVSSIPGLAHQVAGPISGRWLAAGLMKYMGRHAGQDKARRARESGRARKEARAVTLPGLLHAAAIAHAANVARQAVARGMSDEAAAQEAARALAAGAASAKRAAEFNASFRAAVAQAVGGTAGDEVSEAASRWLGVSPSAAPPARSRRGTRAPASLGAAVVAAAAGSSPASSDGSDWRRGAAAHFDGDGEESVRDEYDADGRLAMARRAADAEGMQGHGGSVLTLLATVRRRQLEAAAAAVAAQATPGVRSHAAEAAAGGRAGRSPPERGLDSTAALLEVQAAVAGGDVGALVAAGIDPASAAAASAELVERLRRGEAVSDETAIVPAKRRPVPAASTQIAPRGLVLSARAVSNLLLQLRLRRARDLKADTTPLERLSLLPALALQASRVAELAMRRDRSLATMGQEELQARLAETRAIEEAGVADVAGADARAAAALRAAALRHIARHPADVARVEANDPTSHAAIVARAQGAGRRWREPGMSVGALGGGGDLLAIAWGGADLAARTGRRATRSEAAAASAVAAAARGSSVALGGAAMDPLMQVSSTGFGRLGFDRHGRRVDTEAEARNVVLWRQREQQDATERARRRISLQREAQRAARAAARAHGGPVVLGAALKRFDPSQFPLPASWLGSHGGAEHGGAGAAPGRSGAGRFDPGRGRGVRPMDASLDARAFAVAEQPMTEAERKTAWQNKARLAASSTAAPIAGEDLALGEAPAPSWAGHAARAIHRSAGGRGGASPSPRSRDFSSQPRFSGVGTTDVDAAIDHEIAAQAASEGQLGAALTRGGIRAAPSAAAPGDESARSRDALSSAIRSAADHHWRRGGRDSVAGGDAATAATGVTVGRSTVAGPPGVPMGDLMPPPREMRRSSQQPQHHHRSGSSAHRGHGDDEPLARRSPPPGLAYDPQDLELEDEIGVTHAR
ncbi:hypothetical protein FNF27_03070 [Cafeteria roenbergensis]|nr:hypothetical protein FNF27_03070 [Cafeteria roenbergensis]